LQFGRNDLDHPLSTDCALAAQDDGLSLKGVVQSLLWVTPFSSRMVFRIS
jgi:hypothetical protein